MALLEAVDYARMNLEAVPAIASIMSEPANPEIEAMRAKDGDAMLVIKGRKTIAVDHPETPRRVAANFASAWNVPPESDALVVVCPGLWYEVESALETLPDHVVLFVIEPNSTALRRAVESRDLRAMLKRPRLQLWVGDDLSEFADWMYRRIRATGSNDICIITGTAAARAFAGVSTAFAQAAGVAISRVACEVGTLIHNGAALDTNALRNIAAIPRSRPLSSCYGPGDVIIVGAGPSLDAAAVEILKSTSATVIAVDTVAARLMETGVNVSYIVTLDVTGKAAEFLAPIELEVRRPLVYDPDASWEAVDSWSNLIAGRGESAWQQWALDLLGGDWGHLPKGTSVAHTALDFALAIGADPITLVGVDLAFDENDRTHSTYAIRGWGDGKQTSAHPGTTRVLSVQGKPVNTAQAFATFIPLLAERVAAARIKVYNTSPFGARIAGTIERPLIDVLGQKKTIPFARPRDKFASVLIDGLTGMLEEAHLMMEICASSIQELRRVDSEIGADEAGSEATISAFALTGMIQRAVYAGAVEVKKLKIKAALESDPAVKRQIMKEVYRLYFQTYHAAAIRAEEDIRWTIKRLKRP